MLYLRSENRQEKNYEKNNKRHENNRIQRRESMDPKMASRRRRSIKHIIISQRADSQQSEPISCGPAWACERVRGEKILWDGRVSTSQTTAETVHTSDLLRWSVRDSRNKQWPSLTLKGVVQHLIHMFAELQMKKKTSLHNISHPKCKNNVMCWTISRDSMSYSAAQLHIQQMNMSVNKCISSNYFLKCS